MNKALSGIETAIRKQQYSKQWKPTGTDLSLVGLTTGASATVAWVVEIAFGISVPTPVATFLGSILGLAVARIFKP